MAGFRMTVDDRVMQRKLAAIQGGLEDATPLMRLWGEVAQTSIARNFEEGGRPKWQRLARSTIMRKGHARPLIGRTANLMKIVTRAEPNRLIIGTQPSARDYAAIHQFGGTINHPGGTPYWIPDDKGGLAEFVNKAAGARLDLPVTKPHKITIPARPFIMLQDEDRVEMRETAVSYLKRRAQV